MIALLTALAFAEPECPTHAAAGRVTLEGRSYAVVGRANREAFAEELRLRGCDAVAFEEWRRQVRLVARTGVVGALLWPVWIATGVHAGRALGARRLVVTQSNGEVG